MLTGLNRRIEKNKEIAMLAIEDAESLQQALQACQEQCMTDQTLAQDIALVTGASRGIGRAIAQELARRGATVVGTATSEAGAQGITQWLAEGGFKGRGTGAERGTISIRSMPLLKDIEAHEGAPTILVNNAGITRDNLLLRMKPEEWDDIINTNLGSVFRLSKGVLRGMMKARRGRIISIASVVGVMGNAGQTNYAAAKAGIIGFSKSLAREVGSRGITVNVVAPGFIATDMTAQACRRNSSSSSRHRSRWAGWARPKTSPMRWPFLRRRRPATSPARRCTSMAACTWFESLSSASVFCQPFSQMLAASGS